MNDYEKIQDTFEKLGIRQYESAAIAALFMKHESNAVEISKIANIPYTKIYGILASLEKQRLLKATLGRPKRYTLLEPQTLISLIVEKRQREIEEIKRTADMDFLSRVYANAAAPEANSTITYLPNEETLWNTVAKVINSGKIEGGVIAHEYHWRKIFNDENLTRACFDVAKRGVKMRCIRPMSAKVDDLSKLSDEWVKEKASENISNRIIADEKITYDAIFFDDATLVTSILKPKANEVVGGMLIQDKEVVKGTMDYFNMMWSIAAPVENQIREAAKTELKRREITNY